MTPLPNFVIIGASRCGTTSLHHYLGQHPDIYVTGRKSPNYFVAGDPQPDRENATLKVMASQWISSLQDYQAQFHGAQGERAIGDVSPVYMQSVHAAKRIRDTLGENIKCIAILRNPADRAFAHFLGRRRDGLESEQDFDTIVDRELASPLVDEIAFGSYIACGRYHHFLSPFYSQFAASNIRLVLFERLQQNPADLLSELFTFLGVDPGFEVDATFSHNRSGIIANPLLRMLWTGSVGLRTRMRPYLPAAIRHGSRALLADQVAKPELGSDTRLKISTALSEDILQLERLTGWDLSGWLPASEHPNPQI